MGSGGIAPLFLSSALGGVESLFSCPDRLTPGERFPDTRLGAPQSQSGRHGVQKMFLPLRVQSFPIATELSPLLISCSNVSDSVYRKSLNPEILWWCICFLNGVVSWKRPSDTVRVHVVTKICIPVIWWYSYHHEHIASVGVMFTKDHQFFINVLIFLTTSSWKHFQVLHRLIVLSTAV
jgi:hypothetical protein